MWDLNYGRKKRKSHKGGINTLNSQIRGFKFKILWLLHGHTIGQGRCQDSDAELWFCAKGCFFLHTWHCISWWEKNWVSAVPSQEEIVELHKDLQQVGPPHLLPKHSLTQSPTNIYRASRMSGFVKYLGVQDKHRVKDRSLSHGAYQVSKIPSFPDILSQYWWKRHLSLNLSDFLLTSPLKAPLPLT